jgi:putative membrane protein insertion efficiency factor
MSGINALLDKAKRTITHIFIFSAVFHLQIVYLTANTDFPTDLTEDYRFIINRQAEILSDSDKHKSDKHEISPLGFTANSLLTLYQTFVSSQDNKACNFTPSCSRFARDAINRAGFIKGSLMASDRLLRCHPYSLGKYRIDFTSGEAIDSVDHYLGKQ